MAILDDFGTFVCLNAFGMQKRKKRTKDRKDFDVPKMQSENILSASVYHICSVPKLLLLTCYISQSLSLTFMSMRFVQQSIHNSANLKSSWGDSNTTHTTLSILSYTEKNMLHWTTDGTSKR
ncbi:hypothetical protein H5410_040022 [Solanum commersonii]|uniref:Uncharacterized protein n=1 Tax=Solanum commersonii TaxID=4109 RepID=A0A9J5XQ66_SOLCO|nr:hypothetical protein H5410_040022 [Solanum commersonii]